MVASVRIPRRLAVACATACLLFASAPASAQGGPEITGVDPAAWADVIFATSNSAAPAPALYPPVVITGVDFGEPPGRVYITEGATSLVASVQAPATGTSGAATAPACTWTPTAITLTASCVSPAASGGAGGSVLAPGTGSIQVQGITGTSNAFPVTVQPQVSSLSLAVSPSSAPAGTPETVTVSLQGPGGSVDGAAVSLSVKGEGSGGGPQLAAATLTTGAGGSAATTITDTVPEADLITATYTDTANQHTVTATANATFTGSCANISAITLAALGPAGASAAAASGQGQAVAGGPTLPVVATFAAGGTVGVAGLPVVWRVTGGPGATLTTATAITGSRGTAANAFGAATPGTYTVSAACPGSQAAPGTMQITVASAASVHLTLGPAAAHVAPGRSVGLRVVATNPLTGRPLEGLPIRLRALGSARFAGGGQGITLATGAAGVATVDVSDPACQVAGVTAALAPAASAAGQAAYGAPAPSLPALVAPAGMTLAVAGCRPVPPPSARSGPPCTVRQPFADVAPGPVGNALCVLYTRHLIAGIPSGGRLLYEPARPATLADLAALVPGVLGVYTGQGTPPCAVPAGSWAGSAAAQAAGEFAGVAAAFPHCALTEPATLEDAVSVLVRAAGLEGAPLPASPDTVLAAFPGALGAAPALRGDMATALARGLLPLAGRAVSPAAVLTRGELALLAYRAWSLLRDERAEVPLVDSVSVQYQLGGGAALTIVGSGFGWQPAFAGSGNGTLLITVCPPAGGAGADVASGAPAACWTAGGGASTVGVAGVTAAATGSGAVNVAQWADRRIAVAAICPSGGAGSGAGCVQGAGLAPGDTVSVQVTNPVSGRRAAYRWDVGG